MDIPRTALFTLALGCLGSGALGADVPYQGKGELMVEPSELQWKDIPSLPSGAQMALIEGSLQEPKPFTMRIKMPADYKIPVHTHPAYERVTVLSGALHFGAGKKFDPAKAKAMSAGSMIIMPPASPMFAYTEEDTVIQVHGVGPWGIEYLNPAEDPAKRQQEKPQ